MREIVASNTRDILNPNTVTFDERSFQLQEEEMAAEEARKRAKNSPFSRWTQFNNEHTKELIWLAVKHPKAHAILYFLVDQMDDYNAVMCSSKVIEEVLGVSRQTVSKYIKILKENGFIAILKSGASNIYAINDKVYWKSWGNNKRYSKFPANVVLTLSEQEEGYQYSFGDLESTKHKEVSVG